MMKREIIHIKEAFGHGNSWLLPAAEGFYLIDPAIKPEKLKEKDEIVALVATHGHYDHIGSVDIWRQKYPQLQFLLHPADLSLLSDSRKNASLFFGRPKKFKQPDLFFNHLEELELGDNRYLRVYHTPGHTEGSCCFLYLEKTREAKENYLALITGDTIFATDIGRMDLPGGSEAEMKKSMALLRELKGILPQDLPVLPGHGPAVELADLEQNIWFMNL